MPASRSTRWRCPLPVLAWTQPFVAEHYKPEPRRKVRRNDPFAGGPARQQAPQGSLTMAERNPDEPGEPTFLRRWSQRKLAAAREAATPAPVPGAAAAPAGRASRRRRRPPRPRRPRAGDGAAGFPPSTSLTFDSDFRAFLGPKVEEGTRRAALRKLFSDPRFNVMDGLDVYIDDYSKFEPVTPEVLKQMTHAATSSTRPRRG